MVFAVFFFLCQNVQAQITLSGDATIYLEHDAIISENKSVSNSKDEIFLTSGAIIYHSDSGKSKHAFRQKPSTIKEESALKTAEFQKEKKQKEKIALREIRSQQKQKFFSTQKSDESFSSDNDFPSNIVQNPTYQLKDFIHVKIQSSLVLGWEKICQTHFHSIENQKKQLQLSFFTRPPPPFGI